MKTLLILRHAKSSWKDESLTDHDRPLNKRGKEDAPRVGRLVQNENLVPDIILCSTAKRARITVELVIEACGYEGEVIFSRDLYGAGPEAYIEELTSLPDEINCAMVVGHNPGLEELIEELSGEYQPFPTAALAKLNLPMQSWSELKNDVECKLVNFWRPKEY